MRLGIDIGTFAIRIIVLDDDNRIISKQSVPHKNKVKKVLLELLDELDAEEYRIGICGNMKHLAELDDCSFHEVLCLCKAQSVLKGNVTGIIHLGAQKIYYIALQDGNKPQIYKNSNCSSGTGSFFEEQAGRLGIPLERISDLVRNAKSIPHIAGRCSVFSKTDMIHKMQEGIPEADLINGLCYALVRNFKSSVLKNREVSKPVLLSGGVMKNIGVVEAMRDLLGLGDNDYILDKAAQFDKG